MPGTKSQLTAAQVKLGACGRLGLDDGLNLGSARAYRLSTDRHQRSSPAKNLFHSPSMYWSATTGFKCLAIPAIATSLSNANVSLQSPYTSSICHHSWCLRYLWSGDKSLLSLSSIHNSEIGSSFLRLHLRSHVGMPHGYVSEAATSQHSQKSSRRQKVSMRGASSLS
jgi:hypothetical protein